MLQVWIAAWLFMMWTRATFCMQSEGDEISQRLFCATGLQRNYSAGFVQSNHLFYAEKVMS